MALLTRKNETKTVYISKLSQSELEIFGFSIIRVGKTCVSSEYRMGPERKRDNTIIAVTAGRGAMRNSHGVYEFRAGNFVGHIQDETLEWWTDPSHPLEQYWVTIKGPTAEKHLQALGFTNSAPVICNIVPDSRITELFEHLMKLAQEEDADEKVRWGPIAAFHSICHAISTSVKTENGKPNSRTTAFLAKKLIEAHYHKRITIAEIADRVGMRPEYLATVFKDLFATTPQAYLTRLRLERAKELLKAGVSVKETSFSVGYNDPNYFATMFRKHEGVAPSDLNAVISHHIQQDVL